MPCLNDTRFGTIEYEETDVLTLVDGLIGFPNLRRLLVLNHKPDSPFRWLQSAEEPALAFLVVDPAFYIEDYTPEASSADCQALELTDETPRLLLTTVSIPAGRPKDMTLNLCGPIVVNLENRRAKQIVLDEGAYTMRHRVFPEERVAA